MPKRKENISKIPPIAEPKRLLAKAADFEDAKLSLVIKIIPENKNGRFKKKDPKITLLVIGRELSIDKGTKNCAPNERIKQV